MVIKVKKGIAHGKIVAPPSKSMAHRLLICGAFSEKSLIKGVELSEDIAATLDCLKALGARVEQSGSDVKIGGLSVEKIPENAALHCRESGSTLRFFIPICLLAGKEIKLFGSERLLSRPQSVYKGLCRDKGFTFSNSGEKITVCGSLSAGEYELPGDVSSQFISGLLFALSTLPQQSKIKITGTAESLSYINLTISALRRFGIEVSLQGNELTILGGSYKNTELSVEGDYSNAAFFDALNLLGGSVSVEGLDEASLQGDRVYKLLFCTPFENVDLSDCPDLAPILFSLAAARGGGSFIGTRRLKLKESDRAAAMRAELEKFGVAVEIGENSARISGELSAPTETLCGHNDHRIVMALAVLLTLTGGTISGAEAVSKSLPRFFSMLSSLGIETEVLS